MRPIYIFSLPRTGSTLLQRILAASGDVATAAEPWILLPFLYSLKSEGVAAEYWHSMSAMAMKEFYNECPNGLEDYYEELRSFVLNVYRRRAGRDCRYFLDKTPRYHLICEDILRLFPDGKFLFLWRNPLAVVSSIIHTWYGGKWKVPYFSIDLYEGLRRLVTTFKRNRERVHAVQYERLVRNPIDEIRAVCSYLGLEAVAGQSLVEGFTQIKLNGSMGDKTGIERYNALSRLPLNGWKQTFNNSFRTAWGVKYLDWIGEEDLTIMGYDYHKLKAELRSNRVRQTGNVPMDVLYGALSRLRMAGSAFKMRRSNGRAYVLQ